jgi:hypothetical protein
MLKRAIFAGCILTILTAIFLRAQSPAGGYISNAFPVSSSVACGTTVACAGTPAPSSHIVFGSAPLTSGTPSTATITGITPAFTSTTSYKCTVNDQTAPTNNLVSVTSYASGTSFVITGPATNTDTVAYICVGN